MSQRQIKLLEFSNPVFKDGVNLTTRRGRKWHGVDMAFIQLGGTHTFGPAILATRVLPFNEVTDADLKNEHDPSCRTVEGLAIEMKRVYPEFELTDEVTLVEFILGLRAPAVGDMVWLPDMIPLYAGKVEDVIPLNDDFYEIKFGEENSLSRRAIVHAANYLHDVDDENDGWFIRTKLLTDR